MQDSLSYITLVLIVLVIYLLIIKRKNKEDPKDNTEELNNLKESINKEYSIGYNYFDECFGVNIDFKRSSYAEEDLKPQDILTIMFSFKHVGSYKSTNLAVSENDKQDIKWENYSIDNDLFN